MAPRALRLANRDAWSAYIATGEIPSFSARANKYGAVPVVVDGIRFDSTKESRRYRDLVLLERAGAIRDLVLQPSFPIQVVALWRPGGEIVTVGRFTADFQYRDVATDEIVYEDTKTPATKTTAYRLRKRLVEAIYGVTIREV
jgi:hypothetical protein